MSSPNWVRTVLESDLVGERLAAIEHERWAHWQRYLHDQCERGEDGSLTIPAELAAHWQTLIETPYADLSDQAKESDREQVQRYLPTIIDVLTADDVE
jgi:sugar phosphate isomerase/epimerase